MNIEKIEINAHNVWVDADAPINPPCFVVELLSTGSYDMFQIDTPNDVDVKTQKKIVAADKELGLEGVPSYVEWLAKETIRVSEGIEVEIVRTVWIHGFETAEKELPTWDDVRFIILKSFLLGVDRGEYSKELEDKIIEQLKQGKR